MRHLASLLVLSALSLRPAPLSAQYPLLEFYPVARDRTAAPPDEAALRVVCEKELKGDAVPAGYRGLHLSLLGTGTSRLLLAALSKQKLGTPADAISLHVRYDPLPTALPRRSGTYDWGYLYDRNGDGRVDYLVYLQNAHPVLPDSVPADFPMPEPGAAGRFRVSQALLYKMIELGQMVFRHYADDDFDGRVDGVVVEEFDTVRPMFVRGWLLFRRPVPDGPVEQGWAFRHAPLDTVRVLVPEVGGYRIASVAPDVQSEPAVAVFDRGTEHLALINLVLGQCRLGAEALDRGE